MLHNHTLPLNSSYFFWCIGLLGLLVGSFLNVVIARLPRLMEAETKPSSMPPPPNLISPPSHCPHCHQNIAWYDNIPVLSFIWLKARCRQCHQRISARYPFVELLSLALSVLVAHQFHFTEPLLPALLLTWALIALAFIDYDHTLLPDDITLPFLWLGLGLNAFSLFTDPVSAIFGAIAGYLVLWITYQIFKWVTDKDGMGYGDFKLLAMLGAWLGWQALPLIILLSSFLGAIIGLMLIYLKKRNKNVPIPFGPFLAIAGFVALVWGQSLNLLYFKWLVL